MKSPCSYKPASRLMRSLLGALSCSAIVLTAGCNLDLQNPNDPTEQEVVTDAGGILALAVGLQAQYSSSMLVYARAPSLVTDQWGTAARSLLADRSLFFGVDVLPDYGVVSGPFVSTYRIARSANILIDNAPQVGANRGVQVGAVALAKLLKGMALGNAALQYERLPLDAEVTGGSPQSREVALAEVLRLLESARADLQGVTDAELGLSFRSRGLDPGLDLRSTTNAMLARYYLFTGQHQQAITAADRVDLTTLSRFTFGNPTVNPVYSYSLGGAVYVAALKSFVDSAVPGDQRPAFWVDVSEDPIVGNPTDTLLLPFAAFADRNDPIPLYMPDEMKLIKAEAHTRLGNFEQARSLINEVRTQSSSPVEEPLANLPALPVSALDSEAELLSQIAYERQYELYWVGTRWADLRRLAPFAAAEPSISFLPFPSTECQVNTNAGC